jgi:hypothetical protein
MIEPPFAEHSKEKILLCQQSAPPNVAASFRVRLPAEKFAERFEKFDPFGGAKIPF